MATGSRLSEWSVLLRAHLAESFAREVQYRASSYLAMVGAIADPIILLAVWSAVAAAQGGAVDGMTPHDFAAYFIAAFIVGELTYSFLMFEYDHYISEGSLSYRLLRPTPIAVQDLCDNLCSKAVRMVIIVPAVVLIAAFFRPQINWQPWSLLLFLPATALALALYFALDYGVAICAFWTTRNSAINRLFNTLFILLSGYFAPLELYPQWILTLTWLLPFRWIIAFPIQLLLGQLTRQQTAVGLLMQVLWLSGLTLLVLQFWRISVRRFTSVGG